MVVYNVTVKADWSIHAEWLQWLLQEHIPAMLGTGLFYDYRLMRLLETDESEGPTYAIQYHAQNREDYNRYILEFSMILQEKGNRKWRDKTIGFGTIMEIVN